MPWTVAKPSDIPRPVLEIDRGDPAMHDKVQAALRIGALVRTNANVVAQVWRNGARQARLAKALRQVTVEPITPEDGYRAGELLGGSSPSCWKNR